MHNLFIGLILFRIAPFLTVLLIIGGLIKSCQ